MMRRAKRVSKAHRLAAEPDAVCDLVDAANRATYVGSIEHKTHRSPAGDPRPRRDASKCPVLPAERWPSLTEALRGAIRSGCISDAVDPGGLPRYVWGRFDGELYEARHLSTPDGAYKAYPAVEIDLPDGAMDRIDREPEGHG